MATKINTNPASKAAIADEWWTNPDGTPVNPPFVEGQAYRKHIRVAATDKRNYVITPATAATMNGAAPDGTQYDAATGLWTFSKDVAAQPDTIYTNKILLISESLYKHIYDFDNNTHQKYLLGNSLSGSASNLIIVKPTNSRWVASGNYINSSGSEESRLFYGNDPTVPWSSLTLNTSLSNNVEQVVPVLDINDFSDINANIPVIRLSPGTYPRYLNSAGGWSSITSYPASASSNGETTPIYDSKGKYRGYINCTYVSGNTDVYIRGVVISNAGNRQTINAQISNSGNVFGNGQKPKFYGSYVETEDKIKGVMTRKNEPSGNYIPIYITLSGSYPTYNVFSIASGLGNTYSNNIETVFLKADTGDLINGLVAHNAVLLFSTALSAPTLNNFNENTPTASARRFIKNIKPLTPGTARAIIFGSIDNTVQNQVNNNSGVATISLRPNSLTSANISVSRITIPAADFGANGYNMAAGINI